MRAKVAFLAAAAAFIGVSGLKTGDPRDAQGASRDAQGDSRDAQGASRDAQGASWDAQGASRDAQGDSRDAQGDFSAARGNSGESPAAQGESPAAQGESPAAQGESPAAQGHSRDAQGDSLAAQVDSGERVDFKISQFQRGKTFVKKHPAGATLWIVGLLIAVFATGHVVEDDARTAYDKSIAQEEAQLASWDQSWDADFDALIHRKEEQRSIALQQCKDEGKCDKTSSDGCKKCREDQGRDAVKEERRIQEDIDKELCRSCLKNACGWPEYWCGKLTEEMVEEMSATFKKEKEQLENNRRQLRSKIGIFSTDGVNGVRKLFWDKGQVWRFWDKSGVRSKTDELISGFCLLIILFMLPELIDILTPMNFEIMTPAPAEFFSVLFYPIIIAVYLIFLHGVSFLHGVLNLIRSYGATTLAGLSFFLLVVWALLSCFATFLTMMYSAAAGVNYVGTKLLAGWRELRWHKIARAQGPARDDK